MYVFWIRLAKLAFSDFWSCIAIGKKKFSAFDCQIFPHDKGLSPKKMQVLQA
jgi:hypothetical protein